MNISIVIVTYNRIPALCELLESISRQTIKPYEVIIVNDAGESVEQAKQLYSDLPIQIIDLEQNAGHVEARNAGVKKRRVIVSCCAMMMISLRRYLERMAAALADADFVHSDAEIVSFEERGGTRYPVSRKPFAYTADYADMRVFHVRSVRQHVQAFSA